MLSGILSSLGIQNPFGYGGFSQPDWRQTVEEILGRAALTETHFVSPVSFTDPVFQGAARLRSPSAFTTAAASLGCDVAAIRAVAEVESLGSAFLPSGKPLILYEAHIFSRLTGHKYDKSNPSISTRNWNRSLYGKGGEHQYDRLGQAMRLDRDAALKSASWGSFQILGSNHKACGFKSVEDFIRTVSVGEDENLFVFSAFVKANPKMHKALVARNWEAFARAYNGPGHALNHYAPRLAASCRKYSLA